MNPKTEVAPTFANTGVLTHHDGGCRCWPHVSERDALDAIAAAGLDEYRDGKRAVAAYRARLRERVVRDFLDPCFCDDVGQNPECEACTRIRGVLALIDEED